MPTAYKYSTSKDKMTTSDAAMTQQGNDAMAMNDDKECCHSIPCNSAFNGRAPVEVYFTTQLVSEEQPKDENKSKKTKVFGSQLRGRQLLASEPYQHPQSNATTSSPMQGRLLEIDSSKAKSDEGKVRVVEKFQSIYEWKHECEPNVMQNPSYENSRVLAAFQWSDVAHAVRTTYDNVYGISPNAVSHNIVNV